MRITNFALPLLLGVFGCSAASPDVSIGSTGGGNGVDAGADAGNGGNSNGGSGDGQNASGGSSGSSSGATTGGSTGTPFKECAATQAEAERKLRPVDIIWAIDSSGSMSDEAEIVQANMNAFVQAIEASGIEDYRVVVITDEGFVDVPAPLGTDPQRFLFVPHAIGSSEPQAVLLGELASYQGFLRPEAITHFVIVTDDDESPVTASAFVMGMQNDLGHAFKVHAIASEVSQRCVTFFGCREAACKNSSNSAAAIGREHYAAAAMTGGLTFSICTEDWSALFAELAAAVSVSAPIPCELLMPEPPPGASLNPDEVNVVFREPDADPADKGEPFTRVEAKDACGDAVSWYYDDKNAPTQILLCPSACTLVENGGTLDIALGCETIVQ